MGHSQSALGLNIGGFLPEEEQVWVLICTSPMEELVEPACLDIEVSFTPFSEESCCEDSGPFRPIAIV